ncbi:hypothetical protein [Streptomyces vilmorinianum]|uniref:hypothetical protein n=1 Tax=Streptomyces vilmorinianum TaxID=3051092 RepID=UPI0010FBAA0A|nr:hypothetical protein [Streptomyces vilmorinianum]
MIRHAARALCAASLVIAPLALSTPAHAVTTCRVNGVTVTGGTINGTAGSDYITCATVPAGDTVNGLGGDDFIQVTGTVAGTVTGGAGRDYVTVGTVAGTGSVLGDTENDYLRVGTNGNIVNGGAGLDFCRVGTGNPAAGCEY